MKPYCAGLMVSLVGSGARESIRVVLGSAMKRFATESAQTRGIIQFGGRGRAVVATVATATAHARDGFDHAGGETHFADDIVAGVGDGEVTGQIHHDPRGII